MAKLFDNFSEILTLIYRIGLKDAFDINVNEEKCPYLLIKLFCLPLGFKI